jgi:hypothetical protein
VFEKAGEEQVPIWRRSDVVRITTHDNSGAPPRCFGAVVFDLDQSLMPSAKLLWLSDIYPDFIEEK